MRRVAEERGLDEFRARNQGDAGEFMHFLLDTMDMALRERVSVDGLPSTRENLLRKEFVASHGGSVSPIADMFRVLLQTTVVAKDDSDKSSRFQPETAIHLQLPDLPAKALATGARLTLRRLLDAHFVDEEMVGDCQW